MQRQKAVVGLRRGFGLKLGSNDIEHGLEAFVDGKPPHHRVRMLAGAVGENELAAGQFRKRRSERRIGLNRRMVDLMHDLEIIVGLHSVLDHQPAHRGAVTTVIILLQPKRLVFGDFQKTRNITADTRVDLTPEVEVMRIERVVEIEHPGLDVFESALLPLRHTSWSPSCPRSQPSLRRLRKLACAGIHDL